MTSKINKKYPILAGILSLIFGPIGYLYIGFNFFVAGVVIAVIIGLVLTFLKLPYPEFFNYFQLLVYAYYGYKFAYISNALAATVNLSNNDIKEYKSLSFAFYLMIHVMMTMVQFYAIVVGFYFVFFAFSQGKILIGLLVLVFGIALSQWFLNLIFSFISIIIMKIFKIDKKYL